MKIVFLLRDFERALWRFLTANRADMDAGFGLYRRRTLERSEIAETLRRLLRISDAATTPRGGVNVYKV